MFFFKDERVSLEAQEINIEITMNIELPETYEAILYGNPEQQAMIEETMADIESLPEVGD